MTLLGASAAFLAGVYLAVRFDVDGPALGLFLLAAVLMLALLVVSARRFALPSALILVALLGMLRVELPGDGGASAIAAYHGDRALRVQGVVVSDPQPAGRATRFRLRVDSIAQRDDRKQVSGDVLVTSVPSSELAAHRDRPYFRYGDRLLLVGTVEAPEPIEEFDYPVYLARQGIDSVMAFPDTVLVDEGHGVAFYRWLYSTRRSFADLLARTVPEPQASLGQALLLGIRDDLPKDMVDRFRETGTSHLLAISGLHIGVLLGLSLVASQWVLGRRRHLYLIAPLLLIWLYALVAGMSPSVTRAAIMGTVYLAAYFVGRPRSVLPALGLSAAAMVAIDPQILWSVSFQLSFAAMAGIALLAEPISQRILTSLSRRFVAGSPASSPRAPMAYVVAVGVAATVATLPLVAFHFQRVSLVGIPTTLLAIPALPIVLATQAITGLLGLLSITLAQAFGWLAWFATSYLTFMVDAAARVPGASVETGQLAVPLVWGFYGVLALLYARGWVYRIARMVLTGLPTFFHAPRPFDRGVPWLAVGAAISVAALLWITAVTLRDSKLHVIFLDVGQGDAAFISTPGGQQILVDGGPDPVELVQFLGGSMPFMDRTIELVVLTHPHSDHVGGLIEVLRRYKVEHIVERQLDYDSPSYQAWRRAVEIEGADIFAAEPGQLIAFDDGVLIEVVGPPARLLRGTSSDVDNASVVLRLTYGDVSFLLTGDMFSEAEYALVSRGNNIDSDVLKVAHHGSRSSSSEVFLDNVNPTVTVVSAGENNLYGHPHAETLDSILRLVGNEELFLTSERGTIEFVTDGLRLEVKTER